MKAKNSDNMIKFNDSDKKDEFRTDRSIGRFLNNKKVDYNGQLLRNFKDYKKNKNLKESDYAHNLPRTNYSYTRSRHLSDAVRPLSGNSADVFSGPRQSDHNFTKRNTYAEMISKRQFKANSFSHSTSQSLSLLKFLFICHY